MKLINKPFVFARHAQSTYNANSLIGGFTDSLLSDTGIEQAKEAESILNHIEWSAVITSTLQRTQQTALYAVPNQKIVSFESLKERNWGDLEGRPIAEQVGYEVTPPNGESWFEFERRVISTLNTLLNQYERPLIIAHSGIYRVLNKVINGTPYGPRVGNVSPISFTPSQDENGWLITPFKGKAI